jgi:hypothetical protein
MTQRWVRCCPTTTETECAMQRIKLLGLAVLAVLAVAAVGSASASAEACHKSAGAKTWALCIEGESAGTPTKEEATALTFHIKTGTSAHVDDHEGAPGLVFNCTVVNGEAKWNSKANAEGNIRRLLLLMPGKNCTFESPAECKITGSFEIDEVSGLFGSSAEHLTLTQVLGEAFASFTVSRTSCALWGTWAIYDEGRVSGKGPECTVTGAETERAEQQIVCEAKNSHLTSAGGRAAEIGLEETVELAGTKKGKKFSIIEGT